MQLTPVAIALLCAAGLAAVPVSAAAAQEHAHGPGQSHAVESASSAAAPVHYLTLNIEISDEAIQPSSVFVPAGQPVQLVLRNRGTTEHHYRVVGLSPGELVWAARGSGDQQAGAASDGHDHHDRHFLRSREPSPAGIAPIGGELHAYVSGRSGVDVVLFTARDAGTFTVRCELHPEKTGKLVVFEGEGNPPERVAAPGNALSLAHGSALGRELSRDLGAVDVPGSPPVFVEATYAPPELVPQVLPVGSLDLASMDPGRFVAILLTEGVHEGRLPGRQELPALYLDDSQVALIDSKVVTELPHHRATFYRFARDDAFGSQDQVMTLRLASGQEAVWHIASSTAWSWLLLAGFAASLVFVAWLVWKTGFSAGATSEDELSQAL